MNMVFSHESFRIAIAGEENSYLYDVDIAFHQQEYQRLRDRLQDSYLASSLPEVPLAKAALHDLLLRLRIRS
jgi:hypothetical protein